MLSALQLGSNALSSSVARSLCCLLEQLTLTVPLSTHENEKELKKTSGNLKMSMGGLTAVDWHPIWAVGDGGNRK